MTNVAFIVQPNKILTLECSSRHQHRAAKGQGTHQLHVHVYQKHGRNVVEDGEWAYPSTFHKRGHDALSLLHILLT